MRDELASLIAQAELKAKIDLLAELYEWPYLKVIPNGMLGRKMQVIPRKHIKTKLQKLRIKLNKVKGGHYEG